MNANRLWPILASAGVAILAWWAFFTATDDKQVKEVRIHVVVIVVASLQSLTMLLFQSLESMRRTSRARHVCARVAEQMTRRTLETIPYDHVEMALADLRQTLTLPKHSFVIERIQRAVALLTGVRPSSPTYDSVYPETSAELAQLLSMLAQSTRKNV